MHELELDLPFEIVEDYSGIYLKVGMPMEDVHLFGAERIKLIHRILQGSLHRQLDSSQLAAETGALRYAPCLRPEVLIDATGRLL